MHVTVTNQLDGAVALDFVVFDEQQIFDRPFDELAQSDECLGQPALDDRFGDRRKRAMLEAEVAGVVSGNDQHGNMPRRRIIFQPIEHAPAIDIRETDIQGNPAEVVLTHNQSCSLFLIVVSFRFRIISLMLSFSAATSPDASTLMERIKSPFVTAVATSAMARTCVVRLAAS